MVAVIRDVTERETHQRALERQLRLEKEIAILSRRFLGMEVRRAGFVLEDPRVPHAVRRRIPFSLAYPGTQAAVCINELARTLGFEQREPGSGEGFFRRMAALLRGHLGGGGTAPSQGSSAGEGSSRAASGAGSSGSSAPGMGA